MNIVAIQPPSQEILRIEEAHDESLVSLKGLFGFFARRAALIAAIAVPSFVACFAIMQRCFSGDGLPYASGCDITDLNVDGDVDAGDFGAMLPCLLGTDQTPGC